MATMEQRPLDMSIAELARLADGRSDLLAEEAGLTKADVQDGVRPRMTASESAGIMLSVAGSSHVLICISMGTRIGARGPSVGELAAEASLPSPAMVGALIGGQLFDRPSSQVGRRLVGIGGV